MTGFEIDEIVINVVLYRRHNFTEVVSDYMIIQYLPWDRGAITYV